MPITHFQGSAPAKLALAVTPNDASDLSQPCRSLYVGTGGNITITLAADTGGGTILFANVPSGSILPVFVSRVWSTGTTASNIVALY